MGWDVIVGIWLFGFAIGIIAGAHGTLWIVYKK